MSQQEAIRLIAVGSEAAHGERANSALLDQVVNDLVVLQGLAGQAEQLATGMAIGLASSLYENGWQPADLVHVSRREHGVRGARLATSILIEESIREPAAAHAPQEWAIQLAALADGMVRAAVPHWSAVSSPLAVARTVWDGWHDTLALLGLWNDLGGLPRLLPPPSAWTAPRHATSPRPGAAARSAGRGPTDRRVGAADDGVRSGHNPKMLSRIRALLAKAEATDFAEEADAFTAKAQDLMTRYAIDEALLAEHAHAVEVRSRRVHVDNPYAATKAQLLAAVGAANRVKAIWDDSHGIATIVGLPIDLELTEMLFVSLLVQATRAMTEVGSTTLSGHRVNRSPSFRRAFLLSYAQRIGERLSEAEQHARADESVSRGLDLLPVLARQTAAVEAEFGRLFPDTTKMGAKRVDARGWHAGRAAADRAVFHRGQVAGSG